MSRGSSKPMVSPATSSRDDRGMTLTEVLVVMVIMMGVVGIIAQIFSRSYTHYERQRQYAEARVNTAAALDMIVRLFRSATTINPDPDGNTVLDSVRIIGDWNPKDGDTADAYENVLFTVAGGTLFKQEPTDGAPVPFADRVASLTFTYRDPANALLATPWTVGQSHLGHVIVTLRSTAINGVTGLVTTASASVRRLE